MWRRIKVRVSALKIKRPAKAVAAKSDLITNLRILMVESHPQSAFVRRLSRAHVAERP